MAERRSAGIVLHRTGPAGTEVLLGHMGGPDWRDTDDGGWTIPKGGYDPDEDALVAAVREYTEEVGHPPPPGDPLPLGEVLQWNGKIVTAWALPGDLDPATAVSAWFELEWPAGSGRRGRYPELDRMAWFPLGDAGRKAVPGQAAFFERLARALAAAPAGGAT